MPRITIQEEILRFSSIILASVFMATPALAKRALINSPVPSVGPLPITVCGSPGYVCSRVVPGRTATTSILNNLCVDENGVPYHEPYDERTTWIIPLSQPPEVTLSHRPAQLMINEVEYQMFTSTSDLVVGKYKINYTSINSQHCNNWYFDWAVDVIPEITSDSKDLWWFGKGIEPEGWATFTILRTNKGADSYAWTITKGEDKAKFSNGLTTITTSAPRTKLVSKGRSKAYSDVQVTVSANDVTSDPFSITILAPNSLSEVSFEDEWSTDFGYTSYVSYQIYDQFNVKLPKGKIAASEDFWSGQEYDYPDCNWVIGEPGGSEGNNTDFLTDAMDGQDIKSGMYIPKALTPQHPLGSRMVSHLTGAFYVGSAIPARGLIVQTQKWQKYRDHARHLDKVSPAP